MVLFEGAEVVFSMHKAELRNWARAVPGKRQLAALGHKLPFSCLEVFFPGQGW